jgi:hypothetical protein
MPSNHDIGHSNKNLLAIKIFQVQRSKAAYIFLILNENKEKWHHAPRQNAT